MLGMQTDSMIAVELFYWVLVASLTFVGLLLLRPNWMACCFFTVQTEVGRALFCATSFYLPNVPSGVDYREIIVCATIFWIIFWVLFVSWPAVEPGSVTPCVLLLVLLNLSNGVVQFCNLQHGLENICQAWSGAFRNNIATCSIFFICTV